MNMTVLTPIILFAASAAAMGCAYSALPSQRWWSHPLRSFPAHATAALAAMVALRGWIDVLGAFHGGLAWLSTLGVPLAVLFFAAATPRLRSRKNNNDASVQAGVATNATWNWSTEVIASLKSMR